MNRIRNFVISLFLFACCASQVAAGQARVVCKDSISGRVTIRNGSCVYGEDMVKVLE